MSENHSDLSELKSVFNPLFSAKIRVLFLRFSNLIIRQFIVSITYIKKSLLADEFLYHPIRDSGYFINNLLPIFYPYGIVPLGTQYR